MCKKVSDNYKDNNKTKSTDKYYDVALSMSPLLENTKKNLLYIQFFVVEMKKQDKFWKVQLKEKTKKLKITHEMKNRIIDFFNRSDISRVNPCKKSIKLCMNYSYMRMTYKKAFKKFKEEHPTLQVSLSAFLNIKPEHIIFFPRLHLMLANVYIVQMSI